MFCGCKNDPEEKAPNVNICPICMAHPGALPAINKEAVKHVVKTGRALGGAIADFTEFDRKNYFYPDIPKGYQISQYKYPIVSEGNLNGIEITRVHLEEDTATSKHDRGEYSLLDFNRAGIPLMELVTEPVIHDAETAVRFAKELQLLLRYLGVSDANMEKGEMRVEANISVAPINADGTETRISAPLGTKVEVKNLNSFKVVEKAIEYEIKRQSEKLERGEKIVQETRGWDEDKEETFSQREKESSHDYRYFPDPDLPKLKLSELSEFSAEVLKKEIPEPPWDKRRRLTEILGIKNEAAEIFVTDSRLGNFFDEVAGKLAGRKEAILLASNYITSDITSILKNEDNNIPTVDSFVSLVKMLEEKVVSSRGAKDILAIMCREGGEPNKIAEKGGLLQKSDQSEIILIAKKILGDNEKVVAEFKAGKESALQYLIGQGMRASRGSVNPQMLKKTFLYLLKEN